MTQPHLQMPDGSITTAVLMIITAALNLAKFVAGLSDLAHVAASIAAIGAACTTMYVGFLTIKKLRKEK